MSISLVVNTQVSVSRDERSKQKGEILSEALAVETDENLMLEVKGGNEAAFSVLVERHSRLVYGTVAKMMGSSHSSDVEDVAQEVFVRVYRSAGRYQPTAKFTTWLMTITRNCVFTAYRKHQRRKAEFKLLDAAKENDEGEKAELDFKDDSTQDASQTMLQQEMEKTVNLKIAALPEKQRMALVLRQYHQMDYEEIAKVMKTSVSSVKSLLFRARDTLRNELQAYLSAT
ncbi:MAG: sigma-70 family RNA polymerase sigma factor [Verrucomicrobiota bacterium]